MGAAPISWQKGSALNHRRVEETLRALDDRERVAALERNLAGLEELWSADFTANAPNNQVVVGRKAVLDKFVRAGVAVKRRFTNIWTREDRT